MVSDTTIEISTAIDSVSVNSLNNRPTSPPISNSGRNTATSDRLIESTVKPTSLAPRIAAWTRVLPSSRWRVTFSNTTMASSTTKPVEIVSAISERLLRLKPSRYIAAKEPTIDTGTATLGTAEARTSRRNTNTTRMTNATEVMSVRMVSLSEPRMVIERSTTICRSTSPGSAAISFGNSAFTLSTAWMMLAPGSRDSTSPIAGLPLARPALRKSSTESTTSATSLSLTAALLR